MKKQYIIPAQKITELDMQGLLMKLSGLDDNNGSGNGNGGGDTSQTDIKDGGTGDGSDADVKAEIWDW